MQSVEYVHRWWILRACGRNPLVRGFDRLELLIVALGILVAPSPPRVRGRWGRLYTMRAAACTLRRLRPGIP
jgi:hypothetical protein